MIWTAERRNWIRRCSCERCGTRCNVTLLEIKTVSLWTSALPYDWSQAQERSSSIRWTTEPSIFSGQTKILVCLRRRMRNWIAARTPSQIPTTRGHPQGVEVIRSSEEWRSHDADDIPRSALQDARSLRSKSLSLRQPYLTTGQRVAHEYVGCVGAATLS